MVQRKKYAFSSSIIEIVLASLMLAFTLGSFISDSFWVDYIGWLVAGFVVRLVFSALALADGIISLRLSKSSDESFAGASNAFLAIGIVYGVFALVFSSAFDEITFVVFVLSIILCVFKILAATLKDKVQNAQTGAQKNAFDDALNRLEQVKKLKEDGLITEEEYESLKNDIMRGSLDKN